MGGRQGSGKAEVADETAGKVSWGRFAAQDIAFSTWHIAFSSWDIAFSTWDVAFSTRNYIRVLLDSGGITNLGDKFPDKAEEMSHRQSHRVVKDV